MPIQMNLKEKKIDFIVLAGFLWKIPGTLIKAFPGRSSIYIPPCFPDLVVKGMYGNYVHEAVINCRRKRKWHYDSLCG